MKIEEITSNILNYFSSNFSTYLKGESSTIPTPSSYIEGDIDILSGEEVNFILCVNELIFNELENCSDLLEVGCTIFIIFKIKQKKADANKIVKQYSNALYKIVKENNSLGDVVNYSKTNKMEFYETVENTQFNTKILSCDIRFFKEI